MKNKNTVTSTEAASKAAGVTLLSTNQLVNLWDNLFYQVVSKKSDAVREAIIQMIVADNFLKKDDSQTTKSLITDDVDLQRLANTYVVIPQYVANNIVSKDNTQRVANKGDFKFLDKALDVFEAEMKLESYQTAVDEIHKVIDLNRSENAAAYNTAYETYLADIDTAYSNATASTDASTGKVTYTGLVLPDLNFTENSIFKANYLNGKVSASTLTLVNDLSASGVDDETRLVAALEEEANTLNTAILKGSSDNSKTILYNGTLLRVASKNLAEFSFSATAKRTIKDSSEMVLALNLATGYENARITTHSLSITFDESTVEDQLTLNTEKTTINTALLTSYPETITVPALATSFNLSGIFNLDNGEELTIDTDIVLGGSKSHGNANRKVAQDVTVDHHGIKKVGVIDFRKVDQEICCYVPGEVSRIENILAKEYKERATRQLLSSETTTETTTENEVEKLSDTTTSERNELTSEVSSILDEDKSKAYGGSAFVNGHFGGEKAGITFGANAYYDGASSSSSSNSNSSSQTYAEEVTERALERVVQKVTKKRSSRILREFEENNKHGFDNREGTSHVTGVYRWVDKIYTNKLINYGKRLVYEFDVPEPSKFLKDAIIETIEGQAQSELHSTPAGIVLSQEPASLPAQMTSADAIRAYNYQMWAALYNAEVVAPPKWEIKVAKAFSGGEHEASQGARQFSFNDFEVPEGYKVYGVAWKFDFKYGENENLNCQLQIANNTIYFTNGYPEVHGGSANNKSGSFNVYNYTDTKIPVSLVGWDVGAFALNVTLLCRLTNETVSNWRNETYHAIVSAYQERLNEYNDSILANFVPALPGTQDSTTKLEFNPLLNRSLEKRELKRLAVQMMAKPFEIRTDKGNYMPGSLTNINMTSAFEKHAQYVKFFEQCFDWEIMAYTFYPYFYAQSDNWKALFRQSNGSDPIFQAFLQSSMARMVVPVRPGFEQAVTYFLETGDVWMGNQLAIDRDDDLYLSIAEEVQSTEGVVEKEWETRVPTALTIVQANSAPLTENGLPCCHNEDETENLAYGTSIMVGKDETTPTP
jgi:hypothetical protein